MKSKNQKMETPLLILETRNYCKLASEDDACKHCSVDSYLERSNNHKRPDWNGVISQFSGLGDTLGHVVLKNGASALRDREIGILEQTLESGLSASVTTEGAYVPSDFEARLMELGREYPHKLGVTVSLDGHTKEVYGQLRKEEDFDKTVEFIQRANAGGLNVGVNYVVHEGNVSEIKDYVDFAVNELNVDKVNFLEINLTGGARRNGLKVADSETYFKALIDTYAEGNEKVKLALRGTFAAAIDQYLNEGSGCRGCPAGSEGMAHISCSGEISPCSSLELPQYNAGNVAKVSLSEAMRSRPFAFARTVAESARAKNPLVSMCPGRLESFGELGSYDESIKLTHVITGYLQEKGVNLSDFREADNRCFSPAF